MTREIFWNQLNKHKIKAEKIRLPRDRETQKFKGYAFVELESFEKAKEAKKLLNFNQFFTTPVRVGLL